MVRCLRAATGVASALAPLVAGCGIMVAQIPADLEPQVEPLPIRYSKWWQGGASLDGLQVTNWRYSRQPILSTARWVEFELRETESQSIRWLAVCHYGVQARLRPRYFIVCTYDPVDDAPQVSLTLAAEGNDPLVGAYVIGDRAYRLEGTSEVEPGFPFVYQGTAGLKILEAEGPIGFVSTLPDTLQEAWLRPDVAPQTRRQLLPLVLTFGTVQDARSGNDVQRLPSNDILEVPDPLPAEHPYASHVDYLSTLENPSLRVALLQHLERRPTPQPAEPTPRFGPDRRPQKDPVSFDLSFVGLSFAGALSSSGTSPAADLGWSFGYPLILGASFYDLVHVHGGVEFGGVRPDTEPAAVAVGLPEGLSSSEAYRIAFGAHVTLARLGLFRPFVGGEGVLQLNRSVLDLGDREVGTRTWGFGGAPVFGLRFTADAGSSSLDIVAEGRVDFIDWQDSSRFNFDEDGDARFAEWLERVEANDRSIHLGGRLYVVVRL